MIEQLCNRTSVDGQVLINATLIGAGFDHNAQPLGAELCNSALSLLACVACVDVASQASTWQVSGDGGGSWQSGGSGNPNDDSSAHTWQAFGDAAANWQNVRSGGYLDI